MVFPTAAEAAYPATLCQCMSRCLQDRIQQLGLTLHLDPRLKDLTTMALGTQNLRQPPLISEFLGFEHLPHAVTIPAYKLLASPPSRGGQT